KRSVDARRQQDALAALVRDDAASTCVDAGRQADRRGCPATWNLATAHAGRGRLRRTRGAVPEPESALSGFVVARWETARVPGEPAGHRLGSPHSRCRCDGPAVRHATTTCAVAVS